MGIAEYPAKYLSPLGLLGLSASDMSQSLWEQCLVLMHFSITPFLWRVKYAITNALFYHSFSLEGKICYH